MNVGDLMTRGISTCNPNETLSRAAQLMWDCDCGCLPVVDDAGKAIGMITDRDICMAAYTQGRPLADMTVASAASQSVVSVREGDPIDHAEALMQKHKIRRVPVIDAAGRAVGIVSMNDLARRAHGGLLRRDALHVESIVRTLVAVCEPAVRAESAP